MGFKDSSGFTLIELLIVIGVLAVLATATIFVIQPVEFLARARDAARIIDLKALNQGLEIYEVQGGANFGEAKTIYISLPNTASDCTGAPTYSLPSLPDATWSYACSNSANLRNINSTGWIPIDFMVTPGLSMAVLPIDPINSDADQRYYSYIGGSWELTANTESTKYLYSASNDGGDSVAYEAGTNLKLSPLRRTTFDLDVFPITITSNKPAWKNMSGAGSISLGSDSAGDYLRVSGGKVWYEYQENIPFNPDAKYRVTCKVRQITDPSTGGKAVYCGVAGIASDGIAYLNVTGVNTFSSQHYVAAAGDTLFPGGGYTTFSGYIKGRGTPAGGKKPDPNIPAKMYPGVTYIRPLFILNYNDGNGTADIDFEILEVID